MQSFFGKSKPARPAQVSTVTVKKKVVVRPGAGPSQSPAVARLQSGSKTPTLGNGGPARPTSRDSGAHTPKSKTVANRSSSTTPTGTASPRRRKVASPQRVLPPSDSESSDDEVAVRKRRKLGAGTSGTTPDTSNEELGRTVFCPMLCDERGEWGRGYAGFVTCEEAVRGTVSGWAGGSKSKEMGTRDKYLACECAGGHVDRRLPARGV